jgi:hypothetical protein
MNWVVSLILFQIVAGYVCTTVMFLIWKLTHPGQKPW